MLPSQSLFSTNHFGTDCSACCRRGPYSSHQPLRNRLLSMLPSQSLFSTNHLGTDCSACCRRSPYFPPNTSEPTAQHVAVAVPTSHQPLRNRLLSMLLSWSLLPTNHFGTDCSACCRRGPCFPPTTSEPTAQHVAVAVPTPTNHFGTDCSACCCRGPYFPPTTSEPTAQHVAVAVPAFHQPLRNRLLSMLPSRSLLPTNHFGTYCSACCCRGPYFPPTTSEPTAQHVAVTVPTSHQPLRNRLLSMLPSLSLLPTNHFEPTARHVAVAVPTSHQPLRTDCSACCRRGHYFPPTTSEPTSQHVAVVVPTSQQPLRNDCSACCRRGPYFPPTTSEPTVQHDAVVIPTSHQPLRNRLLSMLPSRSL